MARKSKNTNLKLVQTQQQTDQQAEQQEEKERRAQEYDRWENARKRWMLSPLEITKRVRALRAELEFYREQIEGVPFDIACGDFCSPTSLEYERQYTVALVEDFNPLVKGYFEMIDNFAKDHGCHELLDFNSKLFSLKLHSAETGFQIGLLAGVIFAGCSKEQVDKFERGLAFSLKSNRQVVKAD